MAGGKLSARQKMINMMYLVLTALLALNISKEVLHSFVVINIGLMQQKENIEKKNESTYNQLASEVQTNPKDEKRKLLYAKAGEVTKEAKLLNDYLENLKVELVAKTDGCDKAKAKDRVDHPFTVDRKDDYDRPTLFFGTDKAPGTTGKAADIKKKLEDFKKKLMSYVDEKNKAKIEKNLAILNTNVPEGSETHGDNHSTWEMFYFYHQPQSAALVELTKWQNIVRGAESELLTYFWDQIAATSFKFDAVLAAIVPKSNFVTSGSMFEAEVFLAAYSTSVKPIVIYGASVDSVTGNVPGGITLPEDQFFNGKGQVKVPASGAGERTFGVCLKYINPNTGEIKPYTASCKYNVAPPSATVSASKMNVMYRGLDNPIEVGVPGVAPNNISVNCSGGSMSGGNGKYIVKPGAGKEITISVGAKNSEGKSQNMGSYKFRIKSVPTPQITWAGSKTGGKVSTAAVGNPLIPLMEDFDFPVYAVINSFDISFTGKGGISTTSVTGNQIPSSTASQIKGLSRGAKIFFDNIKVTVPGNERRTVAAIYTIQ